MTVNLKRYADLVRCSPLSECPEWGKCARSLPADPSQRTRPRFEHFGPPPAVEGAKCRHLIQLPGLKQGEEEEEVKS